MVPISKRDKEPGRNFAFPAILTFVNHFSEDFDHIRNDEDMLDDRKEMASTAYHSRKVRRSTRTIWDMQYRSSHLQPDIFPCGFRAVQVQEMMLWPSIESLAIGLHQLRLASGIVRAA
jgi:hypothetical protein